MGTRDDVAHSAQPEHLDHSHLISQLSPFFLQKGLHCGGGVGGGVGGGGGMGVGGTRVMVVVDEGRLHNPQLDPYLRDKVQQQCGVIFVGRILPAPTVRL